MKLPERYVAENAAGKRRMLWENLETDARRAVTSKLFAAVTGTVLCFLYLKSDLGIKPTAKLSRK